MFNLSASLMFENRDFNLVSLWRCSWEALKDKGVVSETISALMGFSGNGKQQGVNEERKIAS
jgi:hypothetical protein